MKLFKFKKTIKNQFNKSKELLLLLITITTFTNLGYVQNCLSKGFSIDEALGTCHDPAIISLNYDLPLIYNFFFVTYYFKYQF